MSIRSMVAASTAAMAHAAARSRMRTASTSLRFGASSSLSLRPRTGRSGESTTAAATTGPKSAPRPASSTPAMAWNPRARNSRSNVASHRNLPLNASGRMGEPLLFALFETGGLAFQAAQVVKLGAPRPARAHHIDVVDHLGMYREDAFHPLAEADLPHGDAFAQTRIVAGDDGALKRLQPFLVAFLDLHVNPNRVAGPERGDFRPLVFLNELRQQRVLHENFLNLLS